MERGQHRNIKRCGLRPKSAALIVDQLKVAVCGGNGQHARVVLRVALGKLIECQRYGAGRYQPSARPRTCAGRNRSGNAATRHLALKRKQHLLGAAATLLVHRRKRIGDIEDVAL